MASQYVDFLLMAEKWWLFFDRRKALEKIQELAAAGLEVKFHQERQQYTVFQIKN